MHPIPLTRSKTNDKENNKTVKRLVIKKMEKNFKKLQKNLVENYIRPAGVIDKRVIDAFYKIPRHIFVPKKFEQEAYYDIPLPIGKSQTISQPSLVGIMTQALHLKGNEKVLEIGTGSGFQSAILSKLATKIYSVEIKKDLADCASKNLALLKCSNVRVINADGSKGLAEFAPYDAIIVTAAARKQISEYLMHQLKENGRLVIPIQENDFNQELMLGTKKGKLIKFTSLEPVMFVPLVENNKIRKQHKYTVP